MKYLYSLALFSLLAFLINCSAPETSRTTAASQNASTTLAFGKAAIRADNRSPLYVSADQGQTWRALKSNLPPETQVSFMEMLGPNMLIATDNLGLFVGNQSFTHFEMISEALPSQKINALHLDEQSIYVGVYRKGIYHSDDLGQNWQSFNFDLPNLRVQAIKVFGNQLVVGTDQGIYHFDRKLSKWENSYPEVQILSLEALGTAWIAASSQGTLISHDQGQNWQWIHESGAVHYTHIVGEQIAEMCISGDLNLSADRGQTWTSANYFPRQASYVYEVVKMDQSLILSNNYGIHRSTDGGQNWALIFPTEEIAFFDLYPRGKLLYGGTRVWDEYRGR